MASGRKEIEIMDVYVDGNTLRTAHTLVRPQEQEEKKISRQAQANRERSMQMNLGYVAFLTVAAIVTVLMCVNYLRLQARYTAIQTQATSLEASLSELKLDNDAEYNRIISGVNLEHVKEELADVLVYCRNMLDKLELDEDEVVNRKMDSNERKYPAEKARGRADKYDQL